MKRQSVIKTSLTSALIGTALIMTPVTQASAHGRHDGGLLFGLAALGTAAVVGVATIVTAPVRAIAAAPAPTYYALAPVYAAPPVYSYAPPPVYYAAPPPVAYAPPPSYAVPPGYMLVPRQ